MEIYILNSHKINPNAWGDHVPPHRSTDRLAAAFHLMPRQGTPKRYFHSRISPYANKKAIRRLLDRLHIRDAVSILSEPVIFGAPSSPSSSVLGVSVSYILPIFRMVS